MSDAEYSAHNTTVITDKEIHYLLSHRVENVISDKMIAENLFAKRNQCSSPLCSALRRLFCTSMCLCRKIVENEITDFCDTCILIFQIPLGL